MSSRLFNDSNNLVDVILPSGGAVQKLCYIDTASVFQVRTSFAQPINGIIVKDYGNGKCTMMVGNGVAQRFSGASVGQAGQKVVEHNTDPSIFIVAGHASAKSNGKICGTVLGSQRGVQQLDVIQYTCFDTSNGAVSSGGSSSSAGIVPGLVNTMASMPTLRQIATNGAGWVKVKQTTISHTGIYKCRYTADVGNTLGLAQAQIYKNGTPYGALYSYNGNFNTVYANEDLTFNAGDTFEIRQVCTQFGPGSIKDAFVTFDIGYYPAPAGTGIID